MDLLVCLCWLAFGGDVTRLDDREYRVREAAHKRLDRAGVLAWPAVYTGWKRAGVEGRNRIDILLRDVPTAGRCIASAVRRQASLPAGFLAGLADAMAADGDLSAEVFGMVDRHGGFRCGSSRGWAERLPYLTGSLAGDTLHVLTESRLRWFAPPVPDRTPFGVPMIMPSPFGDGR